ncbi:hypothetical protein PT2222_140153 [Paraburkholderia tropica]
MSPTYRNNDTSFQKLLTPFVFLFQSRCQLTISRYYKGRSVLLLLLHSMGIFASLCTFAIMTCFGYFRSS